MKKTILAIFMIFILVSICSFTAVSAQEFQKTDDDEVFYSAHSYGPAWFKLFTEVELIDGDEDQIDAVDNLLKRQTFETLSEMFVPVEGLTFKVAYKLPVTRFSRFKYKTVTTEIDINEYNNFDGIENLQDFLDYINMSRSKLNNATSTNVSRRHTYTYENFTGAFLIRRPRLFRLWTPKFLIPSKLEFVGVCENIVKN
jgi:hypothetical protein